MGSRSSITRSEFKKYAGKASRTIALRLNHLIGLDIIKRNGRINDPTQTYEMI